MELGEFGGAHDEEFEELIADDETAVEGKPGDEVGGGALALGFGTDTGTLAQAQAQVQAWHRHWLTRLAGAILLSENGGGKR